mmetsp:Transcript_30763/g.96069  ORF Transcript_30763/g.96069 Transcript_30763/m.96069 type:complete len:313 (+) Transcript_30763:1953-2891(+)
MLSTRPAFEAQGASSASPPGLSTTSHALVPSRNKVHSACTTPCSSVLLSRTSTTSPASTLATSFVPSRESVATVRVLQDMRSRRSPCRPSADSAPTSPLPAASTSALAACSPVSPGTPVGPSQSAPATHGSLSRKAANSSAVTVSPSDIWRTSASTVTPSACMWALRKPNTPCNRTPSRSSALLFENSTAAIACDASTCASSRLRFSGASFSILFATKRCSRVWDSRESRANSTSSCLNFACHFDASTAIERASLELLTCFCCSVRRSFAVASASLASFSVVASSSQTVCASSEVMLSSLSSANLSRADASC